MIFCVFLCVAKNNFTYFSPINDIHTQADINKYLVNKLQTLKYKLCKTKVGNSVFGYT